MNNKQMIETLQGDLERSGTQIQSHLYWIKSKTRNIEEQFKKNKIGEEMNISFNSLGEFQGSATQVDMEIANFCSLQKIIKMLENSEKNK